MNIYPGFSMNISKHIHPLDLLLVGLFALATIRLGVPLLEQMRFEGSVKELIGFVDSLDTETATKTEKGKTFAIEVRDSNEDLTSGSTSIVLSGLDTYRVSVSKNKDSSVEIYTVGDKKLKLVTVKDGIDG